jgi:hypothetical protein
VAQLPFSKDDVDDTEGDVNGQDAEVIRKKGKGTTGVW